MRDILLYQIENFLKTHYKSSLPILLGFSGGPDSLALLYLLLECKAFFPGLDIQLAHVNHQWRPESTEQALHFRQMAERLGLPYFEKIEEISETKHNLEARAREARLRFFQETYFRTNSQALVLAHHMDDQAETVMKRIFEGADFLNCGGLLPLTQIGGMCIWRPLLAFPKNNITRWLEKKKLAGIDDYTNRDPKYLRARMRSKIFPQLAAEFGKQITGNLCHLGSYAQEMNSYLNRQTEKYLKLLQVGPLGVRIDFRQMDRIEKIELKVFIKQFANSQKFFVSRQMIDFLADGILEGKPNCNLASGEKKFYLDRGVMYYFNISPPIFDAQIDLDLRQVENHRNETFELGGLKWNLQFKPMPTNNLYLPVSNFWSGHLSAALPAGSYQLTPAQLSDPYPRRSPLKKWWCSQDVPAFFRTVFPVVRQKREIVHEFLTGKSFIKKEEGFILLSIEVQKL